jgi:ligand-binding SRPBCC domain-containing protein
VRIYTLQCEMLTDQTVDRTFSIFEEPYNLAKITPPWLNFKVTSRSPVQMHQGAEIEYTIRWLGIPIRWKTVIAEYCPPHHFVDEQAKGPYTLWRHRHTFEQTSEGVRIADRVDYVLPFGLLGRLVHGALIRRQLIGIFRYRQEEIAKMLGGRIKEVVEPVVTVEARS